MKPGDLAYWYFRLNGFFTIVNFVLHPLRMGGQLTDADIFGVRFPDRAEFADLPDFDDVEFRTLDLPLFLCAEVTRDQCKLNGPWTDSNRGNINALLPPRFRPMPSRADRRRGFRAVQDRAPP